MDDRATDLVPEVPDFDLLRPVGRGGFGEVWLARNRTTGHLRAIKLIPLRQPGTGNAAAREISSLSRLESHLHCDHPNLLPIHHVGRTASHLFYVMDPADDSSGAAASDDIGYRPATLQTRLEDDLLEPDVCLDYARQLLAGLAALHAAGMVHRDVKPANCLLVGGQLKLADFGLLTESHPLVSRLGTQKYMPPDGRMDTRADVYAAGLVVYEMLSGRPVDDFPRLGPQSQKVGCSPILTALLALVLRACEREPQNRFTDARAMLAELERLLQSPPHMPRRRVLAITGAAIVLVGVAVGAWMLPVSRVDVSFVTDPYEARIYLDGVLSVDSEHRPYTTPCTVDSLLATTHQVEFECEGLPRWDAGRHDFARTQQIVSQRPQ
jgi:eukaryotic-like serine/threonine-protein kinase